MATITHDTLDWYGWDEDGAGVHDVIGTRCDPYTNLLLTGMEYHHCCHSNLTRALATERNLPLEEAEFMFASSAASCVTLRCCSLQRQPRAPRLGV